MTPRGGPGAARPAIGPLRLGGGAGRSGTSGLQRGGSGELSREAVKRVEALGLRVLEWFGFFCLFVSFLLRFAFLVDGP